ncbi:MAG: hypothetical protein Q8930_19180 [Bacillota bacterium]|nr:hypothetical protein [Bacillota bacterium]
MKLPYIHNESELQQLIEEIGFLPMFRSNIAGFSVEECTPRQYWFVDGVEGPWEWREKIASAGNIAYAKLFDKKAGFVSKRWYPDLVNYRRDGYDFDARYEDGLASRKCKILIDLLTEKGNMLSTDMKELGGFGKDGEKGFDSALTLLQMQTYITVKCFEHKRDKSGREYGWGIGRYALSEAVFGADFVTSKYKSEPEESKKLIANHIAKLFPEASDSQIEKLIK